MSTKTNDSESNKPVRTIDIYVTDIGPLEFVKENSKNPVPKSSSKPNDHDPQILDKHQQTPQTVSPDSDPSH